MTKTVQDAISAQINESLKSAISLNEWNPFKKRVLYLAYGSNCDPVQMKERCPSAREMGKVTLKGYGFVWREYADVEPFSSKSVQCALWSINEDEVFQHKNKKKDRKTLDEYEGINHPNAYDRKWVEVLYKGKPVKALLYVVKEGSKRQKAGPFKSEYFEKLKRGYAHFDIPVSQMTTEALYYTPLPDGAAARPAASGPRPGTMPKGTSKPTPPRRTGAPTPPSAAPAPAPKPSPAPAAPPPSDDPPPRSGRTPNT